MMQHVGQSGRREWVTAILLVVLALAMAGCGGPSSVAQHSPTPTPTLAPTATTRPAAAPTPTGIPCGQLIDANNPVVARVGDLQFTRPILLAIDPLRQLPDSLSNQPYAVNAGTDTRNYLESFAPVNVHMYEYALCNNSATTSHTVGQFTVKLNAFTADANTINTSHYCIHVYSRQGMLDHTGCGGAFAGGTVNLTASFASTGAEGTVQPALDHSGQQVPPLMIQPGYAITVTIDVTPSTVMGTSIYRFGVSVDGAAPVYPATDSAAVVNATTLRQWDGDACQTSAMQALIPPATTPPTYYVCPQA
jgi:hypothetical protein